MFQSYIHNPKDCSFEGQDPDEEILLLLRAHPITTLKWIISALMLFFLPFFIPSFFALAGLEFISIPDNFKIVFLIINYLLVLIITFEGFLHWYFNVYIVTNRNVIDVDFHSIIFKNIDVAPLRNVEDTSSTTSGVFGSIFHFGNVFIQTAGASRNIDFTNVPSPHKVADFILDETHKIHKGGV